LEDALEATGFLVGRSSRWARRATKGGKGGGGGDGGAGGADSNGDEAAEGGPVASSGSRGGGSHSGAAGGSYSQETLQSLSNIDEGLVNTDLIEAMVAHLLSQRAQQGQQGQQAQQRGGRRDDDANAILIFAPGPGLLLMYA
jgi:hypothetical protein